MITVSYSPALTTPVAEFFGEIGSMNCLYNGRTYTVSTMPPIIYNSLKLEVAADPNLKTSLQLMHSEESAQLEQLLFCRFSNFDNTPDFENGELLSAEYVACNKRGKCPHEFTVCKPISLKYGELTIKQTEALRLIGRGFLDKEICSQMNISIETLRKHKDEISRKAGLERKSALAVLAYKLNLI